MKYPLRLLVFALSVVLLPFYAQGQCTPGDEVSCPDPEDNGEICPDTLAPIFINTDYQQEITMLAPPRVDTLNLSFDLHHITLISIDGLPDGISWVTNAENDEFMAGIYYCILFSGTTNDTPGVYPLRIVVDLYALIAGDPVNIFTLTDSTSLSLEVLESADFIAEGQGAIAGISPNPFRDRLSIAMAPHVTGPVEIQVYDLAGAVVHRTVGTPAMEGNALRLDLQGVPPGAYFVTVLFDNRRYTRLVTKID